MFEFVPKYKTLSKTQQGIQFIAKDQRVRCLAHIINLACQDALQTLNRSQTRDAAEINFSCDDSETKSESADKDVDVEDLSKNAASVSIFSRACIHLHSHSSHTIQVILNSNYYIYQMIASATDSSGCCQN
jgi:hypothetical protein